MNPLLWIDKLLDLLTRVVPTKRKPESMPTPSGMQLSRRVAGGWLVRYKGHSIYHLDRETAVTLALRAYADQGSK